MFLQHGFQDTLLWCVTISYEIVELFENFFYDPNYYEHTTKNYNLIVIEFVTHQ